MSTSDRRVTVGFRVVRGHREDGWWVTVTAGDNRREFGPYPDESMAVEATGELLRILTGQDDAQQQEQP